jgi:hypothetical protein
LIRVDISVLIPRIFTSDEKCLNLKTKDFFHTGDGSYGNLHPGSRIQEGCWYFLRAFAAILHIDIDQIS